MPRSPGNRRVDRHESVIGVDHHHGPSGRASAPPSCGISWNRRPLLNGTWPADQDQVRPPKPDRQEAAGEIDRAMARGSALDLAAFDPSPIPPRRMKLRRRWSVRAAPPPPRHQALPERQRRQIGKSWVLEAKTIADRRCPAQRRHGPAPPANLLIPNHPSERGGGISNEPGAQSWRREDED